MGKFTNGLLFGIGIGVFIAPMPGKEMRRLLAERFQQLRDYVPEREQISQYTQKASEQTSYIISNVKDSASQVKGTAQQTASQFKGNAQQAASQVKSSAQQAVSQVKDTAQQAASQVKGSTQQAASQVMTAGSNVSDFTQQLRARVKQSEKDGTQTAKQAALLQPQTTEASPATATTASTAPIVKPAESTPFSTSTMGTTPSSTNPTLNTLSAGAGTSQGSLLATIPGIETDTQEKLHVAGIDTIEQLLKQSSTREQRAELAQRVGVSPQRLKNLTNYVDFTRLKGIGRDEATLLEEAGVNGSKDLQNRNPENLHTKLVEVQTVRKVTANTPSLDQVTEWVAEAMGVAEYE